MREITNTQRLADDAKRHADKATMYANIATACAVVNLIVVAFLVCWYVVSL